MPGYDRDDRIRSLKEQLAESARADLRTLRIVEAYWVRLRTVRRATNQDYEKILSSLADAHDALKRLEDDLLGGAA